MKNNEIINRHANQEVLENANAIPDKYFTYPTGMPNKSFILEPLPESIAQQMGCIGKKVLIGYRTLKRNKQRHRELSKFGARRVKKILNRALYHATAIQPGNKQTYKLLVSFKDANGNQNSNAYSTVNVNSTEQPDYVVVVDWYAESV